MLSADKTFGELLKKARKEKGLTQNALASKVNKTESLIRKYEKGLVNPNSTLMDIANALGKPISYFYSVYDNPETAKKQPKDLKEMSTDEIRQLILYATNELINRI